MTAQPQKPISIPFNKPPVVGGEIEEMAKAIASGHLSGDGMHTRECHQLLESFLGQGRVLLTTSCTHALEMAAILLNIGPGDEVILPSYGFVSTVNAFVLRGAKPVFVDIRKDTLNLDEGLVEAAITDRTRAIVPIHYAGVGCALDQIMDVANRHALQVVEDNAHGLFGRYRGKPLGSFGDMATLSFHETKNLTCGEGGALVVNKTDYFQRAEIIREKGTNRSRFFRGQVDKYSWVDVGSSYLPSEILAAFLSVQLKRWKEIQVKRRHLWQNYHDALKEWAGNNAVQLPHVPADCEQAHHMFYLVMPSETIRDSVINQLRFNGVQSVFHYLPLHLSEMGMRYGGRPGDCPVTEDISNRLVRLPFYYSLTKAEQEQVCEAVRSVVW